MSQELETWERKVKKSQAATTRRSNGLFPTMSVAHVDDADEIHKPGELYRVDKAFPNGDKYVGQWSDNSPNGHGKCAWEDGCSYVGEWLGGRPAGKGKFTWPSGAAYEGRFKNGFMDGEGSYTDASNDSYSGGWVCNARHGKGTRSYANGDCYEGQWRRNKPDGRGRYLWSNGNEYAGQWKHGKMHGSGTMIWENGNQYEGSWREGLPRGNGTFRWVDGGFYVGVWSEDPSEQSGSYYPSASNAGAFDWDPQEVYLVKLNDCRVSNGEKITVFPSEKKVNWPCDGDSLQKQSPWRSCYNRGDDDVMLRTANVDGESSLGSESERSLGGSGGCEREADGCSTSDDLDASRGHLRPRIVIKPAKRQGLTISKGHKNYDLMLNLQLGIRHAVGRPAPSTSLDLKGSAFDPREKMWTKFPPEGSKHTPPHQSCEFKWKDYCPLVFRTLRKLFKVDQADYMMSLCGDDALRQLSSPGKSGSFFYLTSDDKYMIKTMKKSEVKVLKRMLQAYYNHVRAFENTLVTRFFGLHCVKMTGAAQKKVRFVVMGNLFCTEHAIHRRFDLKGSSHGRLTAKPESDVDSSTTLKDLDLNFIFRLHKSKFQELRRQVDRDCQFLEQERIMDYSLLLGVHFTEVSNSGRALNPEANNIPRSPLGDKTSESLSESENSLASSRLGSSLPARAELTERRSNGEPQLVGEPTGEYYDVVLVFGIIDILQGYDMGKKLEHAYKSFQHDPTSISAVDPRNYSRRFKDFINRVFTEDAR